MNHDNNSINSEAFKSVIENSTDLTIITDADGVATYVSPQCKNVIGYDDEEIRGCHSGFDGNRWDGRRACNAKASGYGSRCDRNCHKRLFRQLYSIQS